MNTHSCEHSPISSPSGVIGSARWLGTVSRHDVSLHNDTVPWYRASYLLKSKYEVEKGII